MKRITIFLFPLLLLSLSLFTSCEEDNYDDPFGDPVEKFLGNWKCEETGDIGGYFGPFDVEIIRNPENTAQVFIKNFNYQGMDEMALAIIDGSSITIPLQKICDDTIEIEGSGFFGNGEFTLNYRTNDSADEEIIDARFFKP
ncbi:MAG: hypothetical protein ACOCX0_03975 [Bacteroidota bacterium]